MNPPASTSAFRERLGMYLLGIAIGCAILGFIFSMRRQAMQQPGAQNPAPPPSSPTPH